MTVRGLSGEPALQLSFSLIECCSMPGNGQMLSDTLPGLIPAFFLQTRNLILGNLLKVVYVSFLRASLRGRTHIYTHDELCFFLNHNDVFLWVSFFSLLKN